MGEHYTMWITTGCPFCVEAKDILFDRKVNHTINIMDNDADKLQKLKEQHDHHTVPLITYRKQSSAIEVLIGGCDDLKNWLGLKKE